MREKIHVSLVIEVCELEEMVENFLSCRPKIYQKMINYMKKNSLRGPEFLDLLDRLVEKAYEYIYKALLQDELLNLIEETGCRKFALGPASSIDIDYDEDLQLTDEAFKIPIGYIVSLVYEIIEDYFVDPNRDEFEDFYEYLMSEFPWDDFNYIVYDELKPFLTTKILEKLTHNVSLTKI